LAPKESSLSALRLKAEHVGVAHDEDGLFRAGTFLPVEYRSLREEGGGQDK
jgi:hypothetical protein